MFKGFFHELFNKFKRKTPNFGSYLAPSALIEFTPTIACDVIVKDLVDYHIGRGKQILLVISSAKKNLYTMKMEDYLDIGVVKLAIIGLEGEPMNLKSNTVWIPINQLEWFSELWKTLSSNNLVIFEPLSDLVLINDVRPTYKFFRATLESLLNKKCSIIAFINKEAHPPLVVSSFEDLFQKIAEIGPTGELVIKKAV